MRQSTLYIGNIIYYIIEVDDNNTFRSLVCDVYIVTFDRRSFILYNDILFI